MNKYTFELAGKYKDNAKYISEVTKLDVENTTYAEIEYFGRKEQEKIDSKALKEAIINAMVHNDYSSGIPPVFEIFSDRFTITSYGGLPQEITQEDFFNAVSAPRNKELMRVFKDVDLVEQLGSGMERIMSVYDKSIFEFLPNFLRINFYFDKEVLEYLGQNPQETTQETYAMLNETQIEIIKLINDNPGITQKEIAKELDITRDGIKYNMKVLKEMNIIKREGPTKKGIWKILE